MERNAAGDVIPPSFPPYSESSPLRPQPPMLPPHVSSVRFKLYFATQPSSQQPATSSSSSGDVHGHGDSSLLPSTWVDTRAQQLAHLMIPFRLPFPGELTLQGLADQATSRIAKRHTSLTDRYVIEGFDVVPLMWSGMLVGSTTTSSATNSAANLTFTVPQTKQPALVPKPPTVGASLPSEPLATIHGDHHSNAPPHHNGWYYDTSASYRLDLAMNGPDELEFYFALPPLSTTAPFLNHPAAVMSLGSPPPFEVIIVWALKDGAAPLDAAVALTPTPSPSSQKGFVGNMQQPPLFPLRPSSVEGANGGRSSPAVTATATRPPLPPIPRGNTPTVNASRQPPMEPKRPQEGNARFHRQPTPPGLTAIADDTAARATSQLPGKLPSVNTSAEDGELRGLKNYYLPRHNSDSIIDISGNHTPQRAAISPPIGSAGKGNSGRRSVTTFVEDDGLLTTTNGDGAPLVASSLPPLAPPQISTLQASLAAGGHGTPSATATRNTSPDSEANVEDYVGFQAQMIAMTESDDRETILMQEDMEAQSTYRARLASFEMLKAAAASAGTTSAKAQVYSGAPQRVPHVVPPATHAPIVYEMKIEVPRHGPSPTHQPNNAGPGESPRGLLGAMTSPSPPSVRSTMEKPVSPTTLDAVCTSPRTLAPEELQAVSPKVPVEAPTPRGSSVPMEPRRPSLEDFHSQHVVSSASVQAALAFAAVPTSQSVIEQLRHSQNEERLGEEDSSDNEAILLACDELLHEWLQLRHVVLTDERKHFRVVTQQHKMEWRELQGGETMTTIRDEALAQHAHVQALLGSPSPSPARDRGGQLPLATGSVSPLRSSHGVPLQPAVQQHQAPQLDRYTANSGLSSYEVEARGVGLSTPIPDSSRGTSLPKHHSASSQQPQAGSHPPPHAPPTSAPRALDEAVIRLIKIVDVTEQAGRREIKDAEINHCERLMETFAIDLKRIELRVEQALINQSRNTLQDERQRRAELLEVEDRKFSMFASLCNKGIARIRASELSSANQLRM